MENFKSPPKHYFISESIKSEKKLIKRKKHHLDTRKKVVSSPPSPSHILNTLDVVQSPNRSGGEDIPSLMKGTPKAG